MRITLCGSSRFEEEYHHWNELLSLKGHVVYGLAAYPSQHDGNKDWYTDEQKTTLDLVHLSKIDNSDAIAVLNVGGYIGDSTRREMEWARMNDKEIYLLDYSENPLDPLYLISRDSWPLKHLLVDQS